MKMRTINGYIMDKKKKKKFCLQLQGIFKTLVREGNFPVSDVLGSHCGSVGDLGWERLLVLQPITTSSQPNPESCMQPFFKVWICCTN